MLFYDAYFFFCLCLFWHLFCIAVFQGIVRTEDAVFEFQAYRLLYATLNGAQDELNVELDEVAALPPHQRGRAEIVCCC